MPVSPDELKKISQLSYIEIDAAVQEKLSEEITSIMDFVDQLRNVDTHGVAPLYHPLAISQRFRNDEVSEESCLTQLEEIAPFFEENLYLVPKVIESGS